MKNTFWSNEIHVGIHGSLSNKVIGVQLWRIDSIRLREYTEILIEHWIESNFTKFLPFLAFLKKTYKPLVAMEYNWTSSTSSFIV